MIKEFLTKDGKTIPNVAFMVDSQFLSVVLPCFKIQTAVKVTPNFHTTQTWPIIYLAVHSKTKKPVLLLDNILVAEAGLSESIIGIFSRLLCIMGVKRIIAVGGATSAKKNIKAGNICSIEDHGPYFANNPLVGPNREEWGTRFPDVSKIYKKGDSLKILEELEKKFGIAKVNGQWFPSLKGYHDIADKKFTKGGLRLDIMVTKGIVDAIVTHHMSRDTPKEFIYLALVTRGYKDSKLSLDKALIR